MSLVVNIIIVIVGYLLGSIPMGLLAVRVTTGRDVRNIGSGRIGGTNVMRAAGPWIALASGLGDVAKGFLAVQLARTFGGAPLVEALAGVAAVLGHNYSIFIGFRGGAGTAPTLGSAFGLWPGYGITLLVVGAIVIVVTRYASLGSIIAGLLLPAFILLRIWQVGEPWAYLIYGICVPGLTLWALRPNIQRLLAGEERKVTWRKTV
jgi:acyl phosphate:glycerol-3-phosphate acyltransferase